MINELKQWAKKNRTIVIALSLIVLLMFMNGNMGKQSVSPEVCSQFSGLTADKWNACNPSIGCAKSSFSSAANFLFLDDLGAILSRMLELKTSMNCVPKNSIPSGGYAWDLPSDACISKYGTVSYSNPIYKQYVCIDTPIEYQCKAGFMGELGKFVLNLGLDTWITNCSTAGIIGIGGGILFFVLILSFI